MASIEELIELAKNPAELPENFHEELQEAVLSSWEPYTSKVQTLEEERDQLRDKVRDYAVANFDLMRKSSTDDGAPGKVDDEPPARMSTTDLVSKMMEK